MGRMPGPSTLRTSNGGPGITDRRPSSWAANFGQAEDLLLALSVVFASQQPALACSCDRTPTADRILKRSTEIFTGIVEESIPTAPRQAITTFRIIEAFKGTSAGAVVRVMHNSGPLASCRVRFALGTTYTLAVHQIGSGAALSTSLCSRWMFSPGVALGDRLIERMREVRKTDSGGLTPSPAMVATSAPAESDPVGLNDFGTLD